MVVRGDWGSAGQPALADWTRSLRGDTLRLFLLLSAGAYGLWHLPHVVTGVAEASVPYWTLFVVVAPGLAASAALQTRWPRGAAAVLLGTGVLSTLAALGLLATPAPTLLLPMLVLAAVGLFHLWAGAITAAAALTGLVALWRLGPLAFIGSDRIAETAAACALSLLAAWALERNTGAAAGWALASYESARRSAEDARRQRGELVQANKQLDEAYWRLEQLNLELERARRAAQEARRLKEQFAMAVSHELRTPLNLILGFCEMMVVAPSSAYGQKLPPTYRGDLEAMYRNASHLSALVDDILDLSQIDADRMALHRGWTTLAEVVAEATATVETLFLHRDLALRTNLPPDLPAVHVDRTRIRQILINLLGNAARLVQSGGVTVSGWTEADAVVLAVTDTGPGIAAEDLPYVFQEFRQLGDLDKRRGGSGLGLAVSRRFAELHGGTLSVESQPGVGSTFLLRLPLVGDARPTIPAPEPWDGRLSTLVRGEERHRVAVVDDGGEVAAVIRRYLDEYEVVPVGDVEASVREHRVEPLEAAILSSPGALERWRALSRSAPQLRELPLVTCSLRTTRTTAHEMAVDDYLMKPVTREQLRSALRRLKRSVRGVLIVDDDPGMTRLLTRMVRSAAHGATVWTADDGDTALRLMRQHRPDVVLLDLLMPRVDGYAVLEAMRGDEALRDIAIVVVSARGLHDETVVATNLALSREEGLSVGEAMRWLKAGLKALREGGTSAEESPAASPA